MDTLPQTPQNKPAVPSETVAPSPGKWRHPQYDEIVRRQNASTFGERHVRILVLNALALLAVHVLHALMFRKSAKQSQYALYLPTTAPDIVFLIIRLYFVVNMMIALFPLFRPKDTFSDIPLTPSQRAVLGISTKEPVPETPGSVYSTPPRYKPVSANIRNISGKGSNSPTGSPLSPGFRSPSYRRAPSSPSPLFQRSMNSPDLNASVSSAAGGYSTPTRATFGSSYTSSGLQDSLASAYPPSSPSLSSPKRVVTPYLANKWLYEKTRPGAL
ncbi:hypothetical protein KEM56_007525 [Ascosphaera pollenicola]|nr:hypothetical protein KEM56_007525 [Ascosphaera pollenicola]